MLLATVATSVASVGLPAIATAQPPGEAIISGVVGGTPGETATVEVLAVRPSDYVKGIPQRLSYVPAGSGVAVGGGRFKLDVARDPSFAEAGAVNYVVDSRIGNRLSSVWTSVPVGSTIHPGLVQMGRYTPTSPTVLHGLDVVAGATAATGNSGDGPPVGCETSTTNPLTGQKTPPYEDVTRIGEVHVGSNSEAPGFSEQFVYTNSADTTSTVGVNASFTVGYEGGGGAAFQASGTTTVSNGIGTHSAFTSPEGTLQYINTHTDFQMYYNQGPECAYAEFIKPVEEFGDTFYGTNTPPSNPYGSCNLDPYGQAFVEHRDSYGADRSHAVTYSDSADIAGFAFASSTGYNTNIYDNFINTDPDSIWGVCGNNNTPNDASILYSSIIASGVVTLIAPASTPAATGPTGNTGASATTGNTAPSAGTTGSSGTGTTGNTGS